MLTLCQPFCSQHNTCIVTINLHSSPERGRLYCTHVTRRNGQLRLTCPHCLPAKWGIQCMTTCLWSPYTQPLYGTTSWQYAVCVCVYIYIGLQPFGVILKNQIQIFTKNDFDVATIRHTFCEVHCNLSQVLPRLLVTICTVLFYFQKHFLLYKHQHNITYLMYRAQNVFFKKKVLLFQTNEISGHAFLVLKTLG